MVRRIRRASLVLLALCAASWRASAREPAAAGHRGEIDHLKIATDFADCMLRYGRDRYGEVHSPLFAVLLTRAAEPRIGPHPRFADPGRRGNYPDFNRFDYNRLLNYPRGLGSEGPHKVTLYGCDPYEDRALYETLRELSRITGEPRYRRAADEALEWWFRHTQGPTGLYPWGEHLGWDFEHECPTYFRGPSKFLYGACYHEVKDTVPFLDVLARIPAAAPGRRTPLERYALGIWKAHFWDKGRAYYDRHGDYTGHDDRQGCANGFPAHLGAYLRVWAWAWVHSRDHTFKAEMESILHRVLDMAVSRSEKYGFFPFTFEPDLKGRDPGAKPPGQSIRLAGHALEVAAQLGKGLPDVQAKLARLAELHGLNRPGPRPGGIPGTGPRAVVRDLSGSREPEPYAKTILANLDLYRQHGDRAFLDLARTYAKAAHGRFCDDRCPLPKARVDSDQARTAQGKRFPDYYFRGARLMKAFALLGEALHETGQR